jgi:hypothetical protein
VPSPKASLALITRTCGMLGTPTPVGTLGQEAVDYEGRVSALVNDDDDLVGYVARLETMNIDEDDDDDDEDDDDVVGGELTDELEPIDVESLNSDELMAEVERFLRDQPDG